jgi:hypothetical protein
MFFCKVNLYNSVSLRNYRPVHLTNSNHNLNNNIAGQNFHHSQVISIPDIQYLQTEDGELINTSNIRCKNILFKRVSQKLYRRLLILARHHK